MTTTPYDHIRYRVASGNLRAYWFSFEPTGDEAIDLILAAVAHAGGSAHSTEYWGPSLHDDDEGPMLAELIQHFADLAAGVIR